MVVLLLMLLKLCLYCFLGKSTLVGLVIVSILIQSLLHVRYHISTVTPDAPINIIESLFSVMLLIIKLLLLLRSRAITVST